MNTYRHDDMKSRVRMDLKRASGENHSNSKEKSVKSRAGLSEEQKKLERDYERNRKRAAIAVNEFLLHGDIRILSGDCSQSDWLYDYLPACMMHP